MNPSTYQRALWAVSEALAELSNHVADDDLSPEGLSLVNDGRAGMETLGELVDRRLPNATEALRVLDAVSLWLTGPGRELASMVRHTAARGMGTDLEALICDVEAVRASGPSGPTVMETLMAALLERALESVDSEAHNLESPRYRKDAEDLGTAIRAALQEHRAELARMDAKR